jgi:hypothetical protein
VIPYHTPDFATPHADGLDPERHLPGGWHPFEDLFQESGRRPTRLKASVGSGPVITSHAAGEMKTLKAKNWLNCRVRLVWCLAPALLMTGCIGVIPLPATDHQVHGRVIEKSQTQFITLGRTTRAEVIARLGDKFRNSPRMPVLAYSWEKPAAGVGWWLVVPAGAATGSFERCHWRAFFVAFDPGGKVCRAEFVKLSDQKSLDEQLEDWALRNDGGFAAMVDCVFNPATGRPIFLEKMQESATPIK